MPLIAYVPLTEQLPPETGWHRGRRVNKPRAQIDIDGSRPDRPRVYRATENLSAALDAGEEAVFCNTVDEAQHLLERKYPSPPGARRVFHRSQDGGAWAGYHTDQSDDLWAMPQAVWGHPQSAGCPEGAAPETVLLYLLRAKDEGAEIQVHDDMRQSLIDTFVPEHMREYFRSDYRGPCIALQDGVVLLRHKGGDWFVGYRPQMCLNFVKRRKSLAKRLTPKEGALRQTIVRAERFDRFVFAELTRELADILHNRISTSVPHTSCSSQNFGVIVARPYVDDGRHGCGRGGTVGGIVTSCVQSIVANIKGSAWLFGPAKLRQTKQYKDLQAYVQKASTQEGLRKVCPRYDNQVDELLELLKKPEKKPKAAPVPTAGTPDSKSVAA